MIKYPNFMVRITMFKNVLYCLVAVLVFCKSLQFRQDSLDDWFDQPMVALLQHALNNSTSICMLRKLDAVTFKCFNYVVHYRFFFPHRFDYFLYDMITVLVLNKLPYPIFEFRCHQSSLFRLCYFYSFLNNTAPLHMLRIF